MARTKATKEAGLKADKPPKASRAKKAPTDGAGQASILDQSPGDMPANASAGTNLYLIKAKLRKKFHQLREDELSFDDLGQLKQHVCTVLAMDMPQLEWILTDL
jgi:hypothetical protein